MNDVVELFNMVGNGATAAIALAIWRLDRRVLKLEIENEKGRD